MGKKGRDKDRREKGARSTNVKSSGERNRGKQKGVIVKWDRGNNFHNEFYISKRVSEGPEILWLWFPKFIANICNGFN